MYPAKRHGAKKIFAYFTLNRRLKKLILLCTVETLQITFCNRSLLGLISSVGVILRAYVRKIYVLKYNRGMKGCS